MQRKMSLEHAVEVFAGTMILVSVLLTVFVHPLWVWFTVFIGVNLIQQAFSGICPAAIVLNKVFGFQPAGKAAA